jgi:hypothetical protein
VNAFVGWLLPLVAISIGVSLLALAVGSHQTAPRGHSCTGSACAHRPAPTPAQATAQQAARQEFEECMKASSSGSSGGGGGIGLFGALGRSRGPSSQDREAMAVCSTFLRQDQGSQPVLPTPGPNATAPPVA